MLCVYMLNGEVQNLNLRLIHAQKKMESEEDLEKLIKEYEAQLLNVEMTMNMSEDAVQGDLQNLCEDMKQLIELTKDSLLSLKKKRLLQEIESMQNADKVPIDASLHEVASTSQGDRVTVETGNGDSDVQRLLESLEGTKCQAPFSHEWGQAGYHNALILSAEPSQKISDASDIQVRVLFCNPTSNAMKPCPYFMEGNCRFEDTECRFSHGHVVAFQTLRQFSDPDYSLLHRDAPCIAKFTDGLWYPAIVESVDDVDHKTTVKYSQYGTIATLELEDIIPKEHDSGSESDESDDDCNQMSQIPGSDEEVELLMPVTAWVSTVPTSQALGQWEKHTKGIGSKLMAKMGYVLGMGLGKNGDGRMEPVEAVVLPQGKSLDQVMELKEKAGNRNLLKVDKKLRRKQRKKDKVVQDGYDFEKKASVFDFINKKLAADCSQEASSSNKSQKASTDKQVLKSATMKNLNTQSFQVSEDIRKAQLELERLQTALARNETKDRIVSAQLKEKININEMKLRQLKAHEKAIHGEQHLRKSDKKLTIF